MEHFLSKNTSVGLKLENILYKASSFTVSVGSGTFSKLGIASKLCYSHNDCLVLTQNSV